LTIYVERLAQALARRGHQVTVLTSQYDPRLPRQEIQNEVRVVRVPVALRVSKGVIMPTFGWQATRQVLHHDVIHLHLPQFDAAGVALRGLLARKPTVITYHCDLTLPPGLFNALVNQVVHGMNHLAARFTDKIVTYTQDFGDHSPFLRRYGSKLRVISPPVELPDVSPDKIEEFGLMSGAAEHTPVIGMAARMAAEKGVEVLLNALPEVLARHPNALVLYAGQHSDVLGEEEYLQRLTPLLDRYQEAGNWKFLGVLSPEQMAAFYPNLDALVVPSLNSTESFGLVQIEAMMNGVPVVAANLPGVRQPVAMTGMGAVAPVGDAAGLAQALLSVLENPGRFRRPPEKIAAQFHPDVTAEAYEQLFTDLLAARRGAEKPHPTAQHD
jgi:glycosyltransferase involved in cell wall biosynthesis